jgi:hypothetical protein
MRDRSNRSRAALLLGAVVVLGGVASFLGAEVFGRTGQTPVPSQSPHPIATAQQTPLPSPITACRLTLVGGYNDCAVEVANPTTYCSVSNGSLDDMLQLHGNARDYWLYLHVASGYHGAGVYNTGAGAKVAVRDYLNGAFWLSVPGGVLNVTGKDGSSGTVKADLGFLQGEPTPQIFRLSISGEWRCG